MEGAIVSLQQEGRNRNESGGLILHTCTAFHSTWGLVVHQLPRDLVIRSCLRKTKLSDIRYSLRVRRENMAPEKPLFLPLWIFKCICIPMVYNPLKTVTYHRLAEDRFDHDCLTARRKISAEYLQPSSTSASLTFATRNFNRYRLCVLVSDLNSLY